MTTPASKPKNPYQVVRDGIADLEAARDDRWENGLISLQSAAVRWHNTFVHTTNRIAETEGLPGLEADHRSAVLALSRILVLIDRIEALGVDIATTRRCLAEMWQDPDHLKLVRDVLSHEEDYVLGFGREMPGVAWNGGFFMHGKGIAAFALGQGHDVDVEVLMLRQALDAAIGCLHGDVDIAISAARA